MKTRIALVGAVLCLAVGPASLASSPRSISISPVGNFVIVDDEAVYGNMPAGLSEFLETLSDQGEEVQSVALAGETGWLVVYGDGMVEGEGLPADFVEALNNIRSLERVKGRSFTPDGGWVILYGKNQASWKDIPATAAAFLDGLSTMGGTTLGISFADNDAWVVECSEGRCFFGFPRFLKKLYDEDSAEGDFAIGPSYAASRQKEPTVDQFATPDFLPEELSSRLADAAAEDYRHRKWNAARWNEADLRGHRYQNVFDNFSGN